MKHFSDIQNLAPNSQLSDAERALLATIVYPSSPVTEVKGNTGDWIMLDGSKEFKSGLEIYAMQKQGTSEVVFVTRGTDATPNSAADWGINGANLSFSGYLQPQVKEAVLFVKKFMEDHPRDGFVYSDAGHSKGGGIAQILSHTFGFEGTAIAPAPAGAVVESQVFQNFLKELKITPKGIPEHGFTNYIEKGDVVSDYLEEITIDTGVMESMNPPEAMVAGEHGASTENKIIDLHHLGDKIYVDLEPGTTLSRFNLLEQHSPVDDVLALATEGPSYILGSQIREFEETLEKLSSDKDKIEQGSQSNAQTEAAIKNIDQTISELQQKMDLLGELRLHKLEQEYGHVDNWMRNTDFHVKNPHPEVVDTLKEIYLRGVADIVDANYYFNGIEYKALIESRENLFNQRQELELLSQQNTSVAVQDTMATGIRAIDARLESLGKEIAVLHTNQLELLKTKYGVEVDSWMKTDEFMETILHENGEFKNLSPEKIEKIQDPKTLEKLEEHLELLEHSEQVDFHNIVSVIDQSKIFYVENNPNIFMVLPDGRIIETLALASTDTDTGAGSSRVLNRDNLPSTKEEFVVQLVETGLSVEEAEKLAAVSSLGEGGAEESISAQDIETEETFLGLNEADWQELNTIFSKVEQVEGFGDEVTAMLAAYDAGDDWQVFESSADLVSSLDSMGAANIEGYPGAMGDYSSDIQGVSHLISAIGDFKDLEAALRSGDGWAIARSATAMLEEGFDAYNALADIESLDVYDQSNLDSGGFTGKAGAVAGAAASLVSLGLCVQELADAFDEGDTIAGIQAALGVVESAACAYVAVTAANAALTGVAASAAASMVSSSLPAIGCAIGIAQGLLAIADGDVEAGAEQIAITIATTALCYAGPYGWIGALALQIGSATRGCDGRLLDKGDIIEFTDDIMPGGGRMAEETIDSIETSAEWLTKSYEGSVYLSGFSVDMYEDMGIDIPEDMHAEFKLAQTVIEANSPLRTAQYFQDLEDLSLADVWDSTYITQTIVATVDQIKNNPDFVKSSFVDTPQIIADVVKSLSNPENIGILVKNLFGAEDPPEASAAFTLDADGKVVMQTSGDSAMQQAATAYGNAMVTIMENYRDSGGRLLVDGNLPMLTVVQGEESQVRYHSDSGGETIVSMDNLTGVKIQGILAARDRGDQLDSAVRLATDVHGNIDFGRVDAMMAGLGFVKNGITYTFGETRERYGTSSGSGVIRGGGNDGPEGQHFIAKSTDFTSLPLRPDQLPGQQMGRIRKIIGLDNMFSGAGTELLAMAMAVPGGLVGLASSTLAEDSIEHPGSSDYKVPLDGVERLQYLRELEDFAQPIKAASPVSDQGTFADISGAAELAKALNIHWSTLVREYGPLADISTGAYYYQDTISYNNLLRDGSVVTLSNRGQTDTFLEQQLQSGAISADYLEDGARSFSGRRLAENEISPELRQEIVSSSFSSGSGTVATDAVVFSMAEDSILRFLPSDLFDSAAGGYSNSDELDSFVSFGAAQNGRVWRDANGDIRFEPNPGFVGTSSFSYTVMTPEGELVERVASVIVHNVNDAPVLQDDSFTLDEGESFYLDQLLANDYDPDGDSLLIDHLRGVEHGEVSMLGGRLVFIPEEGYFGDVEFSYWVRDHATSYPVMGNAILSYRDVNRGVTTGDDRFLIMEDTVLTTDVDTLLTNDLEFDGESITFTGLGSASHGSVSLQPDGKTILFTPDQDYSGNEAGFSYSVTDESGHITTGWAEINVLDSREPPVVTSTSHESILEDTILTFSPAEVAKFVSDVDGDSLRLDMITNVTGGTIIVRDGYYSFVPDADYSGPASFDYRANDNHRGTVEGHLEFDVIAANDPIDTGTDVLIATEDQSVTTTVTGLLSNDTDVDGSIFTFVALGAAHHGTVVQGSNGDILFTPDKDYSGDQAGFSYTVRDSEGLESVGLVQVQVAGVNDRPEIVSNSLVIEEDTSVVFDDATLATLIRDVDGAGDTIRLTNVESVAGGTVSENNGVFSFTPDNNYNGVGAVRLTVEDEAGEVLIADIDLTLLAVDDPAATGDDLLTTGEEQSVSISVTELLANDTDVDGDLEFTGLGNGRHGTVSMVGQGIITFAPDKDYFGTDAGFEYLIKDANGGESTGFVSVHVDNVNDTPQITATTITSPEDQALVFDRETIAGFITDPDGDNITLSSIDSAHGGAISENGGVYTFTPDQNYHGAAFLTYSATDSNGGNVTGTLNLDIFSVDDPTLFGAATFTTSEEQSLVVTIAELLANDSDVDGNGELVFTGLGEASHGTVRLINGTGVEFIPDEDYFGEDAGFFYKVCDDDGIGAEGWVTVKVENVNDVPEMIGNRLHLLEDQTVSFTTEEVAKFLVDGDGDLLHLDMVSNVEGGRMELNGGIYTFIPDQNFYGEASFDYLAKNSGGEEIGGHLDLAISPVNDLPGTTSVSVGTIEDNEVTLKVADVMVGAHDVEDGSNLRFGGIDSSLHGDVYVDEQDIIHFLPDRDFFGSAYFCYNVIDSEGGVSQGYVGVDIAGENDMPVALDDDYISAWSNNSYENIFSAVTFLDNDYDVDFDPLQIVAATGVEHGTVTVDSAGNIHYIAQSDDWVGIDSFTYSISDGNGGFAEARAEIDVKINTSPDVYSEFIFTREDIISIISQEQLLANDSDVDGDSMVIVGVDQAEHCTVDLLADGSIRFTPELNYNNKYPGQASFRYTVTDGISDPVTAIAFFDIDPVNDSPILRGERITGAVEDNSFSFTVDDIMANDTDVEMASPYEEDSIAFTGVWGAGHGQISVDSGGTINYVPDRDFCGVETFNYSVVDSYGAESVMQSEIYVQPVNDLPVVEEDIGSTAEDSIWNYYSIAGLVSNDYDVDGDQLTIKNPYLIEGRADVGISGGNLAIKPAYHEDRLVIGYTVDDGHGGEVASKLTINHIIEHNFAPTFSGVYRVERSDPGRFNFSFHAEDRNGGNTWSADWGEISSISAAQLHSNYPFARMNDFGNGHFGFHWRKEAVQQGADYYSNFTLTVRDEDGATGTIFVDYNRMGRVVGNYHYTPVVLDLDGDGIELLDLSAGVQFDWNLDGESEATGWVGADDGILVYDYNHDSVVSYANELSLIEYNPGATTDLEGLQAFDTNQNGQFDAGDEEWQSFGVWQDKNSNGQTDEGEFTSLDEMQMSSVDLQSDEKYHQEDGNIVYGETTCQKEDGSVIVVADVGLNGETIELEPVEEPLLESLPTDIEETEEQESVVENTESAPEATTVASEDERVTLEPDVEEEIVIDQAEINRICDQLQSDMAAHTIDEIPIDTVVFEESGYYDEIVDSSTASELPVEQDNMAIV